VSIGICPPDTQLAEIGQLLRDGARLLTLTGPGGTGKTRLAMESVTRFCAQTGVTSRFVSLGPIGDEDMVASAIASSLRVGASGGRASEAAVRDA
jgi:predicted ATPase